MNHYDDGSASSFSSYDVEEKGEKGGSIRGDSSFDFSSNDGETEATTKTDSKEIVLGHQETKWLSKARLFMAFILLVATAAFATGTNMFMKKIEQDDFTTRYIDFANEILAVSEINAEHIFETYESMSLQMTTYASGTGAQFPNVILPDWGAIVDQAIEQTGAVFITWNPLVSHEDRESYEEYVQQNQQWIEDSLNYTYSPSTLNVSTPPYIFAFDRETGMRTKEAARDLYCPIAQIGPLDTAGDLVGYNAFDFRFFADVFEGMVKANGAILSEVNNLVSQRGNGSDDEAGEYVLDEYYAWPSSFMAAPVYDRLTPGAKLVGAVTAEMPWHMYIQNLIPEGINGIIVVVRNTCAQVFTYQIDGPDVLFLGESDLHDPAFDEHEISSRFTAFNSVEDCTFSFHVFPSRELQAAYETRRPITFTIAVVAIFLFVVVVFVVYDWLVERRQEKVLASAIRSNAVVNSLFPSTVRDRLLEHAVFEQSGSSKKRPKQIGTSLLPRSIDSRMSNNVMQPSGLPSRMITNESSTFHEDANGFNIDPTKRTSGVQVYGSKPIADLFPNASVLFGDIVGFTAWSSAREPSQVFTLLETLYNSFDRVARKLGVFKVETIGDAYMAATGIPEPRDDHAVVLVRFARHCMDQLSRVVQELDCQLGPGTSELAMRFGIHSGPVTAGVLRGEKSRFQLFGDTVNTASRMESTGQPFRIQVSQQTADLLIEAGKNRWLEARQDRVTAKGKGKLQTYWVVFRPPSSHSRGSMTNSSQEYEPYQSLSSTSSEGNSVVVDAAADGMNSRDKQSFKKNIPSSVSQKTYEIERTGIQQTDRLVSWNVDVLQTLLKKVVAIRSPTTEYSPDKELTTTTLSRPGSTVLDEVQEFIVLPERPATYQQDPATIELPSNAVDQLRDYVEVIAANYNDNSFHSFAHACHVGQSVMKLLARVVTPEPMMGRKSTEGMMCGSELHEYTYGIGCDPLTQFACAFAAMIHDVDHSGVPNYQLIKERADLASKYKEKSVAEQNSVDFAWNLLMKPRYKDLQACIYATQEDLERFRQLVVNAVMATDVMDKELNALRRKRWEIAFEDKALSGSECSQSKKQQLKELSNRKATIVIEHLIQASDVAHTMQHWHLYIKWNEKLFHEMYQAYQSGRTDVDPSLNWVEGELNFFQYYIIPLAAKLKDCGVFGVASDEYLTYAMANREEWASKGMDMVQQYMSKYDKNR